MRQNKNRNSLYESSTSPENTGSLKLTFIFQNHFPYFRKSEAVAVFIMDIDANNYN